MDSVLVVILYTDYKYYCRPLMPRIFDDLEYSNKKLLFVTDKNCRGLSNKRTGEQVAAYGRNHGIAYARKQNFDWVFFLDVDTVADDDAIDKLLKADYPLIGGVHAARGNSTEIIGHDYAPFEELERISLNPKDQTGVIDVGGASGGCLLVHKSIFKRVDYSTYQGPRTIPLRHTADDEFLQIQIRKRLGVKPKLDLGVRTWHLSNDGFAYRWYGQKKKFTRNRDRIAFNKRNYAEG